METRVSRPTKEVIIGDERPTVLIGERINPAGKKKLAEALKAGNLEVGGNVFDVPEEEIDSANKF